MKTTFAVAMPRPETHLYEIRMEVAPFPRPVRSFDLVMPVWAPGSYAVRDYARNVRDLAVKDASGRALAVAKAEKSVFRVSLPRQARGPFTVTYRVFAGELTVRTSHLDASHGYGNGPSLFFYVDGRKDEPQAVRFDLPEGWRVSIALPERSGAFQAADYDELVDSPFECGTHRLLEFTAAGVPHEVAIWGSGNEDPERLVRDLTKLAQTAAGLFGGLPYERYLFLVHVAAGAGGGLEHRASQSVGIAPWKFRPEKKYREVLSLFSHELFHVWNVKRIRPRMLGPFDYTKETYTRDLWALEGLTSYYQDVLLARAGLIAPKHLFESFAKNLKEHRDNPGSAVQSAEAASFDAWIRHYKPDANSPNVAESYYRRGALIGLALDLTIRKRTAGKRSLDDVLRALFTKWARRGKGYPDGAWEAESVRLAGADVTRLFDRHVRGLEPLRLEELLPAVGHRLVEKPEKDEDAAEAGRQVRSRGDLGLKTKTQEGKLVVAEVWAGRAAYEAGLEAGDELVAFDGVRAEEEQVERIERDLAPGTSVAVTLFRRSRLLEVPVVLGARRAFTYEVKPVTKPTPQQRRLFAGWLGVPFPGKTGARRRK
jgi:predicted metalloprotease with PDZ domain